MGLENIRKQASTIGVCKDFAKPLIRAKTVHEFAALFFTPQGLEFCVEHGIPSLDEMRTLDSRELAQLGGYVDEKVILHNAERVALFGNAVADLSYDDTGKRHEVILMHGASATIRASGYAVVFVTNAGGTVSTEVADRAKIL
jgi:hypothetical protein